MSFKHPHLVSVLGFMATLLVLSSVHAQQKSQDTKGAYLEVPGNKIYYEEAGKGPPLVLIHDGLVHHVVWNAQFETFANNYRVIRYDRRGYGLSEIPSQAFSNVEDLHTLLHHLGVKQATLIGCSGGGEVAIDFTLAYPDSVSSLVLVGAVISGYGFSGHFLKRQNANMAPLFLRDDRDATLRNWINDPYLTLASNVEGRERLRAMLTGDDVKLFKYPATYEFIQPPVSPALGRLSEVQVPTLIIVGESDIPDVHAHAGVLEVGIPNAERVVVPNAGHLVFIEQIDRFNRIVLDFLNTR